MSKPKAADVIIVGGSFAGLSAALILARCCRKVIVYDNNAPRNARADLVYGYLTREGTSPDNFRKLMIRDLKRFRVEFNITTVSRIVKHKYLFSVHTQKGSLQYARKILLCTGVKDLLPEISGIEKFWGKSVSQFPIAMAMNVATN